MRTEPSRDRSAYNKAYYRSNKTKRLAQREAWFQANREAYNQRRRARYVVNRKARLVDAARQRARRRGLPFDIAVADLSWPAKCPVFGLELNYQSSQRGDRSPSLDRIIPERGYVKGNVAVISLRANRMKNKATPLELRQLADYAASRQ